jgi:uncharacterized protein YdiU (UPF0061 family)
MPGMVPVAACYGGHQFGQWAKRDKLRHGSDVCNCSTQ